MKLPLCLLKFRARRLYYGYYGELQAWDCSPSLAEYIKPNLRQMRERLDGLVAEIKERSHEAP